MGNGIKLLEIKDGTVTARGPLAILLFPFMFLYWLLAVVYHLSSFLIYLAGVAVTYPFMAIGYAGAWLGKRGRDNA